MERTEAVKKALGGHREGKGEKPKTHTHGVHYERADNGGVRAHVHKHHGEGPHSEGFSHTEEHVLPDMEAAGDHLQEHMGDQPETGEMPPQQGAPEPPEGAPEQGM